jgi:hypothetical protein
VTAPMVAPAWPAELGDRELVMAAARIAAGEDVPDAPTAARELAAQALAVADRSPIDDIGEHLDAEHVRSGRTGPAVSDFGGCGRAVWYRDTPPDGYVPLPDEHRRKAIAGQIYHKLYEIARRARYPWRRHEMWIDIPGLDRRGRIDEYDPVLGEVTDLKTGDDWKWDRIGEDGPDESDFAKAMIYGLALEAQGLPIRTVQIIYVHRGTGDDEPFRRDYDPAAAAEALDQLIELATMLDLGIVPPRAGFSPSSWPCKACPARNHCWNVGAAEAAGRSAQSYTLLGAEPDDPSIEWAAGTKYEADRAFRDADQRKEEVKHLLDGVPAGTYGPWVVTPKSRRQPQYKDAFNKVVGVYPLPEEHRPPVEAVADPPRRTDRWVEVKPVRAAKRQRKPRRRKESGDV